jgi:site-specific DNA recombinase
VDVLPPTFRNLRDEVKKGIYGRLKQGLWPFNAPIGYQNTGGGSVKTIHPVQGPLVRRSFELYATGRYSIRSLCARMNNAGLRSCYGRPLSLPAFGKLLQNQFYFGVMEIKKHTYSGIHEPLISKQLFDRTRRVAAGKEVKPTREKERQEFAFRGMVHCSRCNHALYGEKHKGKNYYRCHSLTCKGTSFREDDLVFEVLRPFTYLSLLPNLPKVLADAFDKARPERKAAIKSQVQELRLRIGQTEAKQDKLTDVYIEGNLDAESYQRRRSALHNERFALLGEIEMVQKGEESNEREQQFLELIKALEILAFSDNSHFQRDVVKIAVSNFSATQKTVDLQRSKGLEMLSDMVGVSCGAPELINARTWKRYVTGGNELSTLSSQDIVKYEENFKKIIKIRGRELYQAIVSDEKLDDVTWATNDNSKKTKNFPKAGKRST